LWLFKKKKKNYEKLLKEVEAILIKNDVIPIHLFKDKKVLEYLTYFPFNHIYCLLTHKNLNEYIKVEERNFAKFIKKLKKISRKPVNILLDSPSDYEYNFFSCVGWKDNSRYEEEVKNYKTKLAEYEKQKKIIEKRKIKLWEKPEADTYRYVKKEETLAKCPACIGSGKIPSVIRSWGFSCSECRGTGRTAYLPKVTPVQRLKAKEFEKELEKLQDPEFTSFPRKKKSIFIRVVHGGQLFIVEK
jgi:hypothetical protein